MIRPIVKRSSGYFYWFTEYEFACENPFTEIKKIRKKTKIQKQESWCSKSPILSLINCWALSTGLIISSPQRAYKLFTILLISFKVHGNYTIFFDTIGSNFKLTNIKTIKWNLQKSPSQGESEMLKNNQQHTPVYIIHLAIWSNATVLEIYKNLFCY